MKKILVLLCLLLLTSCSKKVIEDNVLVHKWTDLNTIEELNEKTHGKFIKPGVAGISQERYVIMEYDDGLVGQYSFMVNSDEYILRFSDVVLDSDISDIEINNKPAFDKNKENVRATGTRYRLARWFNVDGQYVLIGPITVDAETFENIVEEIQDLTTN